MTPIKALPLLIGSLLALSPLGLFSLGCDSDYILEENTEPVIPTPTPTNTPGYFTPPPLIEATPSEPFDTGEVGAWSPSLRVEPPIADFGDLFDGCDEQVRLKVYNDGDVPLTITDVYLKTPTEHLELTLYSDLTTLYPGDEGNIRIDGTAKTIGSDSGELWIEATEGNRPSARVPVVGEISLGVEPFTDSYVQLPANEVDVLWVIDNSGSMSENQRKLSSSFQSFMETFARLDIEYHMGAVTTDMSNPTQSGRLQGEFRGGQHYVDWTMRDEGLEDFTRTILSIGDNGSGAEQGLWAVEKATSFPLEDSWNEGFLRDGAFLSIIFLSDEEDQSPGDSSDPSISEVEYYLNHLKALKGSYENVVANAIVSFTSPDGYTQVALTTGGYIYPILGNYDDILVDISWLSAGYQSAFPISQQIAEGGRLEVLVNDTPVLPGPTTWTFDGSLNAVSFFPEGLPPDGATIDITYDVRIPCEPEAPEASEPAPAP